MKRVACMGKGRGWPASLSLPPWVPSRSNVILSETRQFPPIQACSVRRSASRTTKSACAPARRWPRSSSPSARAGTLVTAAIAWSTEAPDATALATQSSSRTAAPASVPSRAAAAARRSTESVWPPSSYSPGGMPNAETLSVTSMTRPSAAAKVSRMASASTWCRSAIRPSVSRESASAPPTTPGLAGHQRALGVVEVGHEVAPRRPPPTTVAASASL